MKIAILSALLLVLGWNTIEAQEKGPLTAEDFIVASISEGMDAAEVQKALGKPRAVASHDNPFDLGAKLVTWNYSGLLIHMGEGNAVNGITITSTKYATRRGLQVGDSVEKLLRFYGEPSSKYQSAWDYQAEHLHVMRVTVRKQKVVSLYLGWLLD